MSTFKNIEKLGLLIWDQDETKGWVEADKLETILQSAQVVYGFPDASHFSGWSSMDKFPNKNPSHTALVVGITPLKKKTKAEAALELLQEMVKTEGYENWYTSAAKRILEMKDEV